MAQGATTPRVLVFIGRVLPERAAVSIDRVELSCEIPDLSAQLSASISVAVSQVAVRVEVEGGDVELVTLKNVVQSLTCSLVDAYGYLAGRGYDVEIVSAVDEKGRHRVFGVEVAPIEEQRQERPLTLGEIWPALWSTEPVLRRALASLREAIRSPEDTGFWCFHAVEALRQHFATPEHGRETQPSWQAMGDALRIKESWARGVADVALPQRHGGLRFMSEDDRIDLMQRAWTVVDRFCVYVGRGFQALPEREFEELQ